jgi:hypothetical protein
LLDVSLKEGDAARRLVGPRLGSGGKTAARKQRLTRLLLKLSNWVSKNLFCKFVRGSGLLGRGYSKKPNAIANGSDGNLTAWVTC